MGFESGGRCASVIIGHGSASVTNWRKGKRVPVNRNAFFRVPGRGGRCGGDWRWGGGRDRRRSVSGAFGRASISGGYCVWKKNGDELGVTTGLVEAADRGRQLPGFR